jgi:hypothetical protein
MAARKPTRLETGFLLLFHAALSGSVIVAYQAVDEVAVQPNGLI